MYNVSILNFKRNYSLAHKSFEGGVCNVLIVLIVLLLIAGDVERNPGPVQSTV